jgi:hypothetical protein
MEQQQPAQMPSPYPASGALACPVCHQSVLPEYYFCPNCGAKLHEAPLSTSPLTQAWIYAFSIILPVICYLLITKWPGIAYARSRDEKTRNVGIVACLLLAFSTIVTFYLAYAETQQVIQASVNSINADMSI